MKELKKKGKKKANEVDVGGKDDDDVVSSRVATEKVASDLKQSREQKEAPMFNGVTSTRHGDTDWIKIESKKTNQKFWFNEKTKENWEELVTRNKDMHIKKYPKLTVEIENDKIIEMVKIIKTLNQMQN